MTSGSAGVMCGYILAFIILVAGYLINVKIALSINQEVANQWAITYFISLINELIIKQILKIGFSLLLMFCLGANKKRGGKFRKFLLKTIN